MVVGAALMVFGVQNLMESPRNNQRPRRSSCLDHLKASIVRLDQIRSMLKEDRLSAIGRFRVNEYWQVGGQWTMRGRGRFPEEDVLRSAGITLHRFQRYCEMLDDRSAEWARSNEYRGNEHIDVEVIVYESGIVGSSQVITFVSSERHLDVLDGIDDVMDLVPGQMAYVGAVGDWYVKFAR